MKKIIFLVLSTTFWISNAQQNPHYTQYMYNMGIVNPAYVTDDLGFVNAGLLYRTQWVGIEGAPKTANVFSNIPLNNKIELGFNFLNDRIGDGISLNENILSLNAAYKIDLSQDLKLSFGIKLGLDHLDVDFSDSNVSNDPFLENDKKTLLNIGTGAFLFHDQYYIGLSTPNLIPGKLNSADGIFYRNELHVFLIGGYVFERGNFKLKPSSVVKIVNGAPITFDVAFNSLYLDRFELGLSYRYQDAVTLMTGLNITPDLRIGYAYDFNTSILNDYNNGSHEFMLTYRFDVIGLGKKYASPRFY